MFTCKRCGEEYLDIEVGEEDYSGKYCVNCIVEIGKIREFSFGETVFAWNRGDDLPEYLTGYFLGSAINVSDDWCRDAGDATLEDFYVLNMNDDETLGVIEVFNCVSTEDPNDKVEAVDCIRNTRLVLDMLIGKCEDFDKLKKIKELLTEE
jgi:hypothetical protein